MVLFPSSSAAGLTLLRHRTIQTTTLRLLRMNVNSLFENLDLIIRTIDGLNFGDEAPPVQPAASS
jgi:hypothetical protein